MRVGVLALQGSFAPHAAALSDCGAEPVEVRQPEHLEGLDAVVVPGGESTTLSKLLVSSGLLEPLADRLAEGLPALGTCAGMILLARSVHDARPDQRSLGVIDISVRRNGYGRQLESFEADLAVGGLGSVRGVFIRAPVVEAVGPGVEVLSCHRDRPVLCRQGRVTVASFHPELTDDRRLHQAFLQEV